jgi:glycosyltransferase involved in cell wall biosynthesis
VNTLVLATASHDNLTTRGESSLVRMIDSVRAARDRLHASGLARLVWSWIDDGSTDGTAAWLGERLRAGDGEHLLATEANNWVAAARNMAVARFRSDFVHLFDSDDEMFPDHLVTGVRALEEPDAEGRRYGAATTRIDVGDAGTVHEDWFDILSSVHVNAAFYRRDVWDFLEGMPALAIHRRIGCEDQDMGAILRQFFEVRKVPDVTWRYWRYDGNYFDRQLDKFSHPFAEVRRFTHYPRELQPLHMEREAHVRDRLRYLKIKLSSATDPQTFAGLQKGPAFTELGLTYW